VDADGTVKVADLGLARTLKTVAAGSREGQVYGTPQYMSPEQIRAEPDLDCRSDIYALGAMLYHLLAGRMMFEGRKADDVASLQLVQDPPDIHAFNPVVSQATWRLLCRMLRKNRAERPADWRAVSAEIVRIRSDLAHGQRTESKVSAAIPAEHRRLMSSRRKAHASGVQARRARQRSRGIRAASSSRNGPMPGLLLGGAILVTSALVLWAMARSSGMRHEPPPPFRSPKPSSGTAAPESVSPEEDLYQALEAARKWAGAHPNDVEGAISRLRAVASRAKYDRIGYLAAREAQKLADARDRKGGAEAMVKLDALADSLVVSQRFAEAAEVYAGYRGPFAAANRDARMDKARGLTSRQRALDEARAKEEELATRHWNDALDGVAAKLADGQLSEARELVAKALSAETASARRQDGSAIADLLDRAGRMDERVLQSFKVQKGQTVTVETSRGVRTFVVSEVRDGQVVGETKLADGMTSVKMGYSLTDLSLRERLRRMGSDQDPEVAIAKGIIAIQTGSGSNAKRFFAAAGPHLSARLVAILDARTTAPQEPPATGNP
jgi:hypothetical protein